MIYLGIKLITYIEFKLITEYYGHHNYLYTSFGYCTVESY